MKSKIVQNLPDRVFEILALNATQPLQVNSCTVGFPAILDERLSCFYNLGWELTCACPLFMHTLMWYHVSRVRKQNFFWPVAYGPFCHILNALGVNTCLKALWNYHYVHRSDLMPFKSWICFHFFLGLLASFLHAWLILTPARQ